MTFTVEQSIMIPLGVTALVIGVVISIILYNKYKYEKTFDAASKRMWYDFTRAILGPFYHYFGWSCKVCGRQYFRAKSARNCCKNGPKKRIDGGYTDEFMGAWIQNNIHDQDNR